MPKKLASAVVGTLAVGLTIPASAAAAQAVTEPRDSEPASPPSDPGDAVPSASLASGVDISTSAHSEAFVDPLADQEYTFSTGHGPRCMPVQGASTYHLGQDLVAEEGTPFAALSDGTVVRTVDGTASRTGFVVLRHNIGGQTYHSGYLHVWDAESHVSVGDNVRAGQTIGVVGDSGPTVTPHLHLEIWQGGWHTGTAMDPAEWLAERGVDLRDGAESVQQRQVPDSCDYFAAESTPLLSSPDSSAAVLTQLSRSAELTSLPGDAANGFVRVTSNGETGWVRQADLTPERPADTGEAAGASEAESPEGLYRVTEPLNARSGPGTDHAIRQGMPTGEEITVTARSGDWVQFTRRGEQVWSHAAYLERVGDPSSSTGESGQSGVRAPGQGDSESPGGSAESTTHTVATPLNLRSGPAASHAIVGGMPAGERVAVLSSNGNWLEIRRANGQQGWSHSAYLEADSTSSEAADQQRAEESSDQEEAAAANSASPEANESETSSTESRDSEDTESAAAAESDPAASAAQTYTVGEEHLNARTGAGISHAVVTVLAPGAAIEVTGRSGDWLSFERSGDTLWVHSAYVDGGSEETPSSEQSTPEEADADAAPDADGGETTDTAPSESSDSEPEEEAEATSTPESTSSASASESSDASDADATTTAWVNMRSGASLDDGVQRTVASGTPLEVLDRAGGWYQVRAGGTTGWIWNDYLEVSEAAVLPEATPQAGPSAESESSESATPEEASSSAGADDSEDPEPSASSRPAEEPSSSAESDAPEESSSDSDSSSADSEDSTSSAESSTSDSSSSSSSSSSSGGSGSDSASDSTSAEATTTAAVNMRSGAGMTHGVTRVVAGGTSVEVLGEQGGWYQVRTGSSTGWIWRDFLDVPEGSTSSSEDSSSESPSSDSTSSEPAGGSDSSSESSSSDSSSPESDSGGSSTSGSSGGSSGGRSGPSSGQHAQSSQGPYSSGWDRLAQCESSGNWSINTGNGYYGGLQFSQQSWQWVGGSGLPHEASKQEQIERAYALWQRQGWGAWPACSASLGLSGDPGGWGDSYFDVHGGTESASTVASAGQWTATYSVPLREEASTSAEKLAQIPRGAVLDAGERSDGWIQVEFDHEGETLTGWVNTRFVTAA